MEISDKHHGTMRGATWEMAACHSGKIGSNIK
jgi:hypothetical protein